MPKSKENVIELEDYRVVNSKVFTGRDRGAYVRDQSKLDALVKKYNHVTIVVPDNIYSINPSFLEEFLVNVVERLGRDEFFKRVRFEHVGPYDPEKRVREAVDSILRVKTGLD